MTLKSIFSRFSRRKSTLILADNFAAETWRCRVLAKPARLIRKVELCTAPAGGRDAWGEPVDKDHLHTFLMVSLLSTSGLPDDVYLVERVLSTGGAHHSVAPIKGRLSKGGSMFHPHVHDRICVVPEARSSALADHLEVERSLEFSNTPSTPGLTLADFAQIVAFINRTTMLIWAGSDCRFQSRAFAFTCLSALTPTLPPAMRVNEGEGMNSQCGADMVGDSVFEHLSASFLEQMPWMVRDQQALRVMSPLK